MTFLILNSYRLLSTYYVASSSITVFYIYCLIRCIWGRMYTLILTYVILLLPFLPQSQLASCLSAGLPESKRRLSHCSLGGYIFIPDAPFAFFVSSGHGLFTRWLCGFALEKFFENASLYRNVFIPSMENHYSNIYTKILGNRGFKTLFLCCSYGIIHSSYYYYFWWGWTWEGP